MPDALGNTTIGLSMIVKNESGVILDCLESVRPLVDFMLIEDTGSSDGTPELIRGYLQREGIPGEVRVEAWRDFAFNRTLGLQMLRERKDIDYALVIDADETLEFEDGFDAAAFKRKLTADLYHVKIIFPPVEYFRPQLLKNHMAFEYRGVLHEFIEGPPGGFSPGTASGLFVRSGRKGGARSKDAKTYNRDTEILKKALIAEKDPFLISRYTFYLAQSYRDSKRPEKAIHYYQRRAKLGFWDQEIFVSLYEVAQLKEELGHAPHDVIGSYLAAYEACPSRAEALHGAVRFCRRKDLHNQGYILGRYAVTIPQPEGGLFIKPWIYDYGILDEFSVVAYWTGNYEESLAASTRLLTEGKLPESDRKRIEMNLEFARGKLKVGTEPQ